MRKGWVVLLALPLSLANHTWESFEGEESGRFRAELLGQKTCVPQVLEGDSPLPSACLSTDWGGVLIFDSLAVTPSLGAHSIELVPPGWSPPSVPSLNFYSSQLFLLLNSNAHRDSGGLLPDVLLPGVMKFNAWLGFWADNNTNGIIDAKFVIGNDGRVTYAAGNEWRMMTSWDVRPVLGYVSPGSHPRLLSPTRPSEVDPDFEYIGYSNDNLQMWRQITTDLDTTLLVDGSLFEEYTVESVTRALLVPGARPDGGERPYSPTEGSLIDIDFYAKLSPDPLSTIYEATLAPLVHEIGSPGISSCPERCTIVPGPAPLLWSTLDPFGRYPQEASEGSGALSSGRIDEYRESYHGYVDLLPMLGPPTEPWQKALGYRSLSPLPSSSRGGLAVPPMTPLVFEVWLGAWRDLNLDGYVGRVDPSDPYEGGARPIPDRFGNSSSEFIPNDGKNPFPGTCHTLSITLVPDSTWEGGALVIDRMTNGAFTAFYYSYDALFNPSLSGCQTKRHSPLYESNETIVLPLLGSSGAGGDRGYFMSTSEILFPQGSPSFVACTTLWSIPLLWGDELVSDCDPIDRWSES